MPDTKNENASLINLIHNQMLRMWVYMYGRSDFCTLSRNFGIFSYKIENPFDLLVIDVGLQTPEGVQPFKIHIEQVEVCAFCKSIRQCLPVSAQRRECHLASVC